MVRTLRTVTNQSTQVKFKYHRKLSESGREEKPGICSERRPKGESVTDEEKSKGGHRMKVYNLNESQVKIPKKREKNEVKEESSTVNNGIKFIVEVQLFKIYSSGL